MHTDASKSLHSSVALCVGAHADDLDFMASGTMAKLASAGTAVYYLILTDGCKGTSDPGVTSEDMKSVRRNEQWEAAEVIGARDVIFLDYEDGTLECSKSLKEDIVRVIRELKPDLVIAMDPTMVYCAERNSINHPDHRAGGQAVLDSVYPLARDHLEFPEQLEAGLWTHAVSTVLLTNFNQANFYVDITDTIDEKLAALQTHASQMIDMELVTRKVRTYGSIDGQKAGCQYAEGFIRLDVQDL